MALDEDAAWTAWVRRSGDLDDREEETDDLDDREALMRRRRCDLSVREERPAALMTERKKSATLMNRERGETGNLNGRERRERRGDLGYRERGGRKK